MKHLLLAAALLSCTVAHAQDTLAVRPMYATGETGLGVAVMIKPGKGSWDQGPRRGYLTAGDSVKVYYNKRLPRLHDSVYDAMLDEYAFVTYPAYPPQLEAGSGWVRKTGLTEDRTLAWVNRPLESVDMFVRPKKLDVREKPNSEAAITGSLDNSTLIKVVRKQGQKQGAWVFVNYFTGAGAPFMKGWVERKDLVSTRDSVQKIPAPLYRPVNEAGHNNPPQRIVSLVATGQATPLPPGYTQHKATVSNKLKRDGTTYYRGPRGGCFIYYPSGKKVYVDRKFCN